MVGRTRSRAGWQAAVMKLLGLAAVIVLAVVLLSQTSAFLKDSGLDPEDGVASVLSENRERTEQGGSSFGTPQPGISPAQLPLAVVTILFRPFLFEANSIQVLITALESTVLLVLTVRRIRPIGRAVRSFRRLPYVTFVVVYGLLFIVAFSSIGNFGILARERCQLLPFFLVLLAVPGVRGRRPRAPATTQPIRRADAGQLVRA
jgi:amino acid transporter